MSQHDVEELKAQLLDAETDARFWRNVSLVLGGLFFGLVVVGVISGGVQIVRVRVEEAHATAALAEAERAAAARMEAARLEFDAQFQEVIRAQAELVAKLEKEAEGPLSDEERVKVNEKLAEAIKSLETLRAAEAKERDPAPEK